MSNRLKILLLTLVLGALAIDGRSLWTDEIGTWELTQYPSWSEWSHAFWHHYNSDGQLPLYHAYMRVWVMLAGDGEWALRAANLPWLALALAGLTRIRIPDLPRAWVLVAAISNAFVWYYVNDARPYLMYAAGASWLTAGMFSFALSQSQPQEVDKGLREFLFGAVFLIGGNVLGVFWILSCLMALALLYPSLFKVVLASLLRQKGWAVGGIGVCLVIFGIAVHSQLSGARASQAAEFSLAGVAYGLIELLGAAGLGPSRNDLRIDVRAADKLQMALMLGLALVAALALLRSWLAVRDGRLRLMILCAAGLPLLLMLAAGMLLHWRVVGRHLSAMLPIVLLGFGAFFHLSLSGRGGAVWRGIGALLLLGLLASALSMRWQPRHLKDDYRQAAAWARAALEQGHSVLWIADLRGLRYYGLLQAREDGSSRPLPGIIPFSRYPEIALSQPYPAVVIYSPREGVDPGRLARPVLDSGRYTKTATAPSFELYTQGGVRPAP